MVGAEPSVDGRYPGSFPMRYVLSNVSTMAKLWVKVDTALEVSRQVRLAADLHPAVPGSPLWERTGSWSSSELPMGPQMRRTPSFLSRMA